MMAFFLQDFPARADANPAMSAMAERLAYDIIHSRLQEGHAIAEDSHIFGPSLCRSDPCERPRI